MIFFLAFALLSLGLTPFLGQDFFPSVDSGQFMIHVRAHTGTRIEETAALCDHVESTIRQEIPSDELVTILDNIGLPYSSLNLSYSTSAPVGTADADIQVQLTRDHHPSEMYIERLREVLDRDYPGVTFYVVPVDIVTQILNFGLSSPIDIQIVGPNLYANRTLAEHMLNEIRYVRGAADVRIQQPFNDPNLTVNVDRTRATSTGLTQQNVAQGLLVALSGSFQTSPNFYLDPRNGVTYNIAIQAPQYNLDTMAAFESLPITSSATNAAMTEPSTSTSTGAPGAAPLGSVAPSQTSGATTAAPGVPRPVQVLSNVATIVPGAELGTISHYDVQPVIDIYTNVEGTDLGSVTRAMQKIVDAHQKDLPRGSQFILRGQSQTMYSSYFALLSGLAFSILLVYLLIVVNFQSWLDPFLIISALPAALAGIVWFLFLTGTAAQRARTDRRHHVHGRGHGQLHSGCEFCARADGDSGWRCTARRTERRLCPPAPGAYDCVGHDHRHGAHGAGPGRRRRAKRPAGPRCHWRPAAGYGGHALLCARLLLFHSRPHRAAARAGRRIRCRALR